MEWIQRNPKKALGLAALGLLFILIVVRGALSGSGKASADPSLGGPSLAVPTATPSQVLTGLPNPSAVPTSKSDLLQALAAGGSDSKSGSFGAGGSSNGLTPHRVVVSSQSDGPLMAVGWWIPLADGTRKGSDTSGSKTFSHGDHTYGDADLARILAYGGPYSKRTSCTVTVDGKVTDHEEAKGPYAKVFCQS